MYMWIRHSSLIHFTSKPHVWFGVGWIKRSESTFFLQKSGNAPKKTQI